MNSLFIFTVLVATAFCQQPRCENTPVARWMGEMHESNHENLDPREPTIRRAYIFYDATNKRINITERELYEPGDRTALISELFIFEGEGGTRYRVQSGVCTKSSLTEGFRPFGVPRNSTYHGNFSLGGTHTGLLTESFSMQSQDNGDYHGFWAEAETGGCVPIIETYRNRNGPVPQRNNVHITFQNIHVARAFPPETFVPPTDCREPPPPKRA